MVSLPVFIVATGLQSEDIKRYIIPEFSPAQYNSPFLSTPKVEILVAPNNPRLELVYPPLSLASRY